MDLPLRTLKFFDPEVTANGAHRARVELLTLRTLWFNTGTLCNLTCNNCYIHSSPTNDNLVYLNIEEVRDFISEISVEKYEPTEIGFTGGEPFLNPDLIKMLELCLSRQFKVLVLTNAMKPMIRYCAPLMSLRQRYSNALNIRVSLDHYTKSLHEMERGQRSWEPALRGLRWLCRNGFRVQVAGRLGHSETEPSVRRGYAALFQREKLEIDAGDGDQLVLFPEMNDGADVPEITEACWATLGISPDQLMCAKARMVVKRKDASRPTVVPCTLLAEDPQFDLGFSLAGSSHQVTLNHPHCASFCVLGGASCSNN